MRCVAIVILLVSPLAAQAQGPQSTAPLPGSVSAMPPVAIPSVPANSPPQPPDVTFQNGLLTIRAENSTLAAVLNEIQSKTGAEIQVPPGASNERVVIQEGPLPPRAALVSLLQGSGFDYIILGNAQNPQGVERVLLTPHIATSAAAQPAGYPASYRPAQEYPNSAENEPPGTTEAPTMPVPAAPQATAAPPAVPGQTPGQPGPPANGIKTPEQLLQELQQIQQGPQPRTGQAGQPKTPPTMPPRRIQANPPH